MNKNTLSRDEITEIVMRVNELRLLRVSLWLAMTQTESTEIAQHIDTKTKELLEIMFPVEVPT